MNDVYFDTPRFEVPGGVQAVGQIVKAAQDLQINLGYRMDNTIHVALDETVDEGDILALLQVFAAGAAVKTVAFDRSTDALAPSFPSGLARTTPFLLHPVFNTHHSETQMMRYIRGLERKDIGLDTSMIPLGSCTMKLNAASEMLPITWPEFGKLHPFAPVDQAQGYQQVFREIEQTLCEITGFAAVSLQPNSGAQGEYAGLLVIRAYLKDRGQSSRNIVLIPVVRARHQSGECGDGRDARGDRREHQRGQHRRRRSQSQSGGAQGPSRGADGDVSVHPRRVRREHPGHLRRSSTSTAARCTWTAPT